MNYTIEYTNQDGTKTRQGLYADRFMAKMNAELANRPSLTELNGFSWNATVVEVT